MKLKRVEYHAPHRLQGECHLYNKCDGVQGAAPTLNSWRAPSTAHLCHHYKTTYDAPHPMHGMVTHFLKDKPAYSVSELDGKVWIHSSDGKTSFMSSMSENDILQSYREQDAEQEPARKRRRKFN